jgi:predicted Fe-Mo cluster-binding NifX family protein
MKTAFATWENRIAPVFDTAHQIHVIEVESGEIVREADEVLTEDLPAHKAVALVDRGVEALVCGAISRPMQILIASYGIQVFAFIAGDLHEVMQAWFAGTLDRNTFGMPGCCGRGRGRMGRSRTWETPSACLCPNCGHREPHEYGVPCAQTTCPKCRSTMLRE